jgi:multiple sugar transport system permease protein
MKSATKIAFAVLMVIALLAMFLPIAQFPENTAGALSGDIEKQQGKVDSAQTQLQRWIDGGKKSEADIEKQRKKVQKEQDKLDALLAQQAESSGEVGDSLSYSFLPGQLPAELEIDQSVINQYKLYNTNFPAYYGCVWAAFGLLALALVLVLLTGNKRVSKLYTFSSLAHLLGIILVCYSLLRLGAFPIKLPYGNAQINGLIAALLVACPIVAFAMHISSVHNSKRSMIYVFCTVLSLLAIVPFWLMMVNATRSSQDIQSSVSIIPGNFIGNNWQVLTSKNWNVATGFRNSAIIALGSTLLSVYFSAMTAYGFKVYQFKGNKFLYAVVMAIIMIPGQVTGTGFFMFMYQIGMTNNLLALIIPSIAAAATVFFFRQYLEANFQISLVEAARIDGCGEFKIFNTIVLPIMVPAMATMGIMAMIGAWNNYLTPLMLLSDSSLKTLPMMVQELRGDIYRTEYGSIYLGLTLTAAPLLIVYFAFSKYIIAGVALGGVKE